MFYVSSHGSLYTHGRSESAYITVALDSLPVFWIHHLIPGRYTPDTFELLFGRRWSYNAGPFVSYRCAIISTCLGQGGRSKFPRFVTVSTFANSQRPTYNTAASTALTNRLCQKPTGSTRCSLREVLSVTEVCLLSFSMAPRRPPNSRHFGFKPAVAGSSSYIFSIYSVEILQLTPLVNDVNGFYCPIECRHAVDVSPSQFIQTAGGGDSLEPIKATMMEKGQR